MFLSDSEIHEYILGGSLKIDPEPDYDVQLQPASLDLRLGSDVILFRKNGDLDIRTPSMWTGQYHRKHIEKGDFHYLLPSDFILASTVEAVTIPDELIGFVEGRSSLGRMGLTIHSTAGVIDPGFSGQITLEITNSNKLPIRLYPDVRICQILFSRVGPLNRSYRDIGRYNGQHGPTISKGGQ